MGNTYEHLFRDAKDYAVHNAALTNINHILGDDSIKLADKFDEIVLIVEEANRSLNK